MKKILLITLSIMLLLCLCSCGADSIYGSNETYDRNTMKSNYDSAVTYIESIIDTSGMTENDQNGDFSINKSWTGGNGLGNDSIDAELIIDDQIVKLGEDTPQDIADMGFQVKVEHEMLEPSQMESFSPEKGEKFTTLSVVNNTEKSQKTMDLPLYQFFGSIDSYNLSFQYHGITKGYTLKNIVDTIGVPSSGINVSATNVDTNIILNYYSETTSGDQTYSDRLTIYILYDADKNTGELESLMLTRQLI